MSAGPAGGLSVTSIRLPTSSVTSSLATPSDSTEKATISSSLALFFRKVVLQDGRFRTFYLRWKFLQVYYLASVRLLDLADRLRLNDKAKQGVWTMFEHVLRKQSWLIKGRHVDQLLMCCLYVVVKVSKLDISFHEIMCQYRYQPQAHSRVYRRVLIEAAGTNASPMTVSTDVESDETSRDSSGTGSGAVVAGAAAGRLLRSRSTLPVPAMGSAPPTPEPKEHEYADLIRFYNRLFVGPVEAFAKKLCPSGDAASKEVATEWSGRCFPETDKLRVLRFRTCPCNCRRCRVSSRRRCRHDVASPTGSSSLLCSCPDSPCRRPDRCATASVAVLIKYCC